MRLDGREGKEGLGSGDATDIQCDIVVSVYKPFPFFICHFDMHHSPFTKHTMVLNNLITIKNLFYTKRSRDMKNIFQKAPSII